jgi:hypothetical protein
MWRAETKPRGVVERPVGTIPAYALVGIGSCSASSGWNTSPSPLVRCLSASLAHVEVMPLVGGLAGHAFGPLRIQLSTIKLHGVPNAQKSERLRQAGTPSIMSDGPTNSRLKASASA